MTETMTYVKIQENGISFVKYWPAKTVVIIANDNRNLLKHYKTYSFSRNELNLSVTCVCIFKACQQWRVVMPE
jgi:hypothetical protein